MTRLGSLDLDSVLEVAAGTGVVTRAMAVGLSEATTVTATDLNQSMVDHGESVGSSRPVRWQAADVMALPFEDGTFDAVVCQFGVMFFPDKPAAFKEVCPVLRPGGAFVFNVWDRIETNEFADVVTSALAEMFPEDPPRFLARTPYGHFDESTIRADVAAGGFAGPVGFDGVEARVARAAASCVTSPSSICSPHVDRSILASERGEPCAVSDRNSDDSATHLLYGSVVPLDPAAYRRVHGAVADGDLAALRRELEQFGDFPNRSPDGAVGLPLVYAVYHGPLELIRVLLDVGADPDGSDGDGFPPLIAALSPPDRDDIADLLGLLLDRGADIEQRGVNDYTPLHCAAASGQPVLVELLLERGADPNSFTRIDDAETPLEVAEAAGHSEVADLLRPKTTLPNWMQAARVGDVVTLRRMVARGQDVDATDGYSQTALMRAAHGGHREAVEFLLSRGADVNRTAKFGLSALMLAVLHRHHKIVRALVRAGADTDLRGTGASGFANKTAADLAEAAGDARLAEYIRREATSN